MSDKKHQKTIDPSEVRKKAKKIVSENPIYIPDEPTTVGNPDNLNEEDKESEDGQPKKEEPKRSNKQ